MSESALFHNLPKDMHTWSQCVISQFQQSLSISSITSLLLALGLLIGCAGQEDSRLEKLDKQRGAAGLVLGDSLYSRIYEAHLEEVEDYEPTEMTVLGHVHSRGMSVDLGKRFLYGVERGETTASALDGAIYMYTMSNSELPSNRVRALRDSLFEVYGTPTHELDSIYVTSQGVVPSRPGIAKQEAIESAVEASVFHVYPRIDSTMKTNAYRWEAEDVTLQFAGQSEERGFAITVFSKRSIDILRKLEQAVDSTLRANKMGPITKVGDFNLLTTSENDLVVSEDKSFTLSDGSEHEYTSHTIPYETVKPFFEIANQRRYRYGDIEAIDVNLRFASDVDSLTELEVSMAESVQESDSFREVEFMTLEKIRQAVQTKLGEPALTTTSTSPEGEHTALYWPGEPFSIIAQEESLSDEISVRFKRTKSVGRDLLSAHRNDPIISPLFFLPWANYDGI